MLLYMRSAIKVSVVQQFMELDGTKWKSRKKEVYILFEVIGMHMLNQPFVLRELIDTGSRHRFDWYQS